MKEWIVTVESRIKEEVIVEADDYDSAIEAYYDGNYIMAEEFDRDVLDTDANERIEQ